MAEAYPSPEFRCLLCQEIYENPRELPCGHTFCSPCLTTYIQAEHVCADEDRHYFPCPVCDTPIVPRDPNIHVNTWWTSFPINHLLLSHTKQISEDQICEACLRDWESSSAEVWCTDCAEMLCKDCKTYHKRNKVSSKHKLVPIDRESCRLKGIIVNDICPNHKTKRLDFYCVNHGSLCCSDCVSLTHRMCNNLKQLDDLVETATPGQNYIEREWKEIREESKRMLDDENSQINNVNSTEKEVSAKMTHEIQRAKDKLDDLNAAFQSDLAHKCNSYRQQINSRLRCVSKFNTNAENSHLLMSRLETQGSDRQTFITREQTKNQLSGHYRRMDQNTKELPNTFDITLKIGQIVEAIMKVTTVGAVDVTSTISLTIQNAKACIGSLLETIISTPSPATSVDPSSGSDLTDSVQRILVISPPTSTLVDVWEGSVSCVQTVHSHTIEVPVKHWLFSGIFTDNRQLLITDCLNNRLLLFDDNYSLVKEYNVDGNPVDVTRGRVANEIFVSLHGNEILKCTLRNGQLSVTERITCPRGTLGIAVHGDNIYAGTYKSVEVLSMDGEVNRSIRKSGGDPCLTTSSSKARVYHRDNNDIVCRRLDNDAEVYRYSDPGLKSPVGIGLDRDENVYVCGMDSRNVYLVSPDGSRGKALLTKLTCIKYPFGIIVHPTKQEFVVTSENDSVSFEVYRFNINA
ncbi:E3 ubiquitin/ISG15 ligase TRIM25-like [Mizuhopecten yessoensis]|uniref:Tripartite motif-containing protein 45 n=1 Tax=Mizuhopecten yessoensis TaxID=6573 RepID=A0A210PXE1_MIZYE|nr:E3 ubiquitin/ISG15 ligase TRIM25-like [Mizuhopecten yessoensis]XP_021372792.1 E3 ubiquitin/ISG15 ligase TRIM25-like [Mizuhopecten yessoensis]OWF41136.1 Tripartite motif-containing protein 45 [Mizuhopecten yessoensis]